MGTSSLNFQTLGVGGVTQLTGDVTAGPGSGSQASTIANDAVTNTKLANMADQTFKGNNAGSTGDPVDLTVAQAKTMLGLTGTNSGDQTITLTGDVTGSGTGSFAATIANDAVTYAKMQNVSAASKLLGRGSAGGSGDVEEITLGTNLSMSGTTLNASGGGSFTQSEVWVHTANGYGSTNTNTARFTTTQSSTGSDITYADSSTLGASWTINSTGVYSLTGWWYTQAASPLFGWTLNQATGTQSINNVSTSERLCIAYQQGAVSDDKYVTVSVTKILTAGDVVRFVGNGSAAAVSSRCGAIVTKVNT